jgi:hypothetical protein
MAIGVIGASNNAAVSLPFGTTRVIETKECKGTTSFTVSAGTYALKSDADFWVYEDNKKAVPARMKAGETNSYTTAGTFKIETADFNRRSLGSQASTGNVTNGILYELPYNSVNKYYVSDDRQSALYHAGGTSDPIFTKDGGATYIRRTSQYCSNNVTTNSHMVATSDFSYIYYPSTNNVNLYRYSTDGGDTWTSGSLSGVPNYRILGIEAVGTKFAMAQATGNNADVSVSIGTGTTRERTFTISYTNGYAFSSAGECTLIANIPNSSYVVVMRRSNSDPTWGYAFFDMDNLPANGGSLTQTGTIQLSQNNIHDTYLKAPEFFILKGTASGNYSQSGYNYFHVFGIGPNGAPAFLMNQSALDYQSASFSSMAKQPSYTSSSSNTFVGLRSTGRAGDLQVRQNTWSINASTSNADLPMSVTYNFRMYGSSNTANVLKYTMADKDRRFDPDFGSSSMSSRPNGAVELPDGRFVIYEDGNAAAIVQSFNITLFEKA